MDQQINKDMIHVFESPLQQEQASALGIGIWNVQVFCDISDSDVVFATPPPPKKKIGADH